MNLLLGEIKIVVQLLPPELPESMFCLTIKTHLIVVVKKSVHVYCLKTKAIALLFV